MAVIAQLSIPADSFELGRILDNGATKKTELEALVPFGDKAVPVFSVGDGVRDDFETTVRRHPSVENISEMSRHENKRLYSLDWNVDRDVFFRGILRHSGTLLGATGTATEWEFDARFPTHDALSAFQEYCTDAHLPLKVGRIYNPGRPGTGMWYGLTPPQRDTLIMAVEGGYYSIPRRKSTKDLARALAISDQAVTERLRRGIETLVENTLIAMDDHSGR